MVCIDTYCISFVHQPQGESVCIVTGNRITDSKYPLQEETWLAPPNEYLHMNRREDRLTLDSTTQLPDNCSTKCTQNNAEVLLCKASSSVVPLVNH